MKKVGSTDRQKNEKTTLTEPLLQGIITVF